MSHALPHALPNALPTGRPDAMSDAMPNAVPNAMPEVSPDAMPGLLAGRMMDDYPLALPGIFRRAEQLFGDRAVVSRRADRAIERATYGDTMRRARRLAMALRRLGVRPGDRVATLAWNSRRHLEAYAAIPWMGAVLHTLNPRLHPDELAYVMNHADDRVLLVDAGLAPLWQAVAPRVPGVRHAIVLHETGAAAATTGLLDYETLLDAEDPGAFEEPAIDERQAAAMCYTSGTTGRPKGVVYSHRALVLHSFVGALGGTFGIAERDVVLPVVPMFHVNAWGLPYTCLLVGAAQVHPGPHLDPASLLELFERERVTFSAGVPTVWLALLQALDAAAAQGEPLAPRLALRALGVGGSAPPEAMIRGFAERHGIPMVHGWGMTETSPLGSVASLPPALDDAPLPERVRYQTHQGRPLPFFEIRARGDDGALVPWDARTVGELEVRGPWVAAGYHHTTEGADRWTADGWFRTGDMVTIAADGTIGITDRAKDLIKSGGEWISSVALENALMGHPAVAEAAVIAVPHPEWQERPLAVVVARAGHEPPTAEALGAWLAPHFARWWLPDAYAFVESIPRGATGKFLKRALRERFGGVQAARSEGAAIEG